MKRVSDPAPPWLTYGSSIARSIDASSRCFLISLLIAYFTVIADPALSARIGPIQDPGLPLTRGSPVASS